jgi:hypothetical protein
MGTLPSAANPLGTAAPPLFPKETQGAAISCMVVVNFVKKKSNQQYSFPHHQ